MCVCVCVQIYTFIFSKTKDPSFSPPFFLLSFHFFSALFGKFLILNHLQCMGGEVCDSLVCSLVYFYFGKWLWVQKDDESPKVYFNRSTFWIIYFVCKFAVFSIFMVYFHFAVLGGVKFAIVLYTV